MVELEELLFAVGPGPILSPIRTRLPKFLGSPAYSLNMALCLHRWLFQNVVSVSFLPCRILHCFIIKTR